MSDPGDLLDGMCDDVGIGDNPATTEDVLPWVVLFADLIGQDQQPIDLVAVHLRAAEWRNLFGGEP